MHVPAVVRRVTDPILRGVPVPVLSGVNRGRWWSLVSAGSGYASGRRSRRQMELVAALVGPSDVAWDVGAHHGFVTLCASRRAGAGGSVHAFEPSATNRALLGRHARWNGLANTTVHPFALSSYDGESCFGGSGTSKMLALGAGRETVLVRRGATLVAEGVCAPPTFMKIDVEGAEADALAGVIPVLPPTARLLIAVHESEATCSASAPSASAGLRTAPRCAPRASDAPPRGPRPGAAAAVPNA